MKLFECNETIDDIYYQKRRIVICMLTDYKQNEYRFIRQ